METYITESIRVVIREHNTSTRFPYMISTEQKLSGFTAPWEEQEDGWRSCVFTCAATMEEATKEYERQIASERRWH